MKTAPRLVRWTRAKSLRNICGGVITAIGYLPFSDVVGGVGFGGGVVAGGA